MSKNIVLSIGLLVSNRRDTIQKCLDSLAPIRKAVPTELIILDTGCDKDLRELLETYADKIDSFVWCKDFSKARNVTLDMAEGEWFLYLDDDEWFTEVDELVDFFHSGKYKNYGTASYIQRNYLDFDGMQYTDTWVGRMIKRDADTCFLSKIHEYLSPQRGEHANLHAIVDHYGYVYKTEEDKQKHFERNYVLLKEMIEEEPEELRWKMQLVQELRTVDAFSDMVSYGKEYLELSGEGHSTGAFYASVVLGYAGLKDYANVKIWCENMRQDTRINQLAKTFAELSAANALFYLGEYQASIEAAERYLEYDKYFKANKDELYRCQSVPFVGEVFDLVKYKEIYSLLMCSGLKLKNVDYLGKYIHKLGWNKGNAYVFEEMADTLIEAICDMGYCKEFYRTIQIIRNHNGLNTYFYGKVEEWHEKGADVTSIENIDKFGIRKNTQKQFLEIVDSLTHVNAIVKNLVEAGNTEQLGAILSEAQNVAISLGTAIENALGLGTKAVGILEGYCEALWNISEAASQEVQLEEAVKLAVLMTSEREEILNLPIKKVAVFLPYKASMWDSLESVWMAARDDAMCEDYVVPIPYFDKNGDGTFKEGHYEGNDYPDYVTVYDWQKTDLAALRPDSIFIHNPYDEFNHVTSVHPDYYSYRLKEYTDKLVYIPYFVTNGGINEINCQVSAILHADKVIVQNEQQKETYTKVYLDLKGQQQRELESALGIKDEAFWQKLEKEADEKFLALGSPKFDKVASTTREDVEIPESWQRLITKEDGSRKKVILYNTTVSALLKQSDQMIEKIKSTLSVFKAQEDVVLLWRPHPLNRTALEFSRPDLHQEYLQIVENYKAEGWGIYDDTVDFHRAIAISDAYYGDGGSTVPLYKATGKPMMMQNVEILN